MVFRASVCFAVTAVRYSDVLHFFDEQIKLIDLLAVKLRVHGVEFAASRKCRRLIHAADQRTIVRCVGLHGFTRADGREKPDRCFTGSVRRMIL